MSTIDLCMCSMRLTANDISSLDLRASLGLNCGAIMQILRSYFSSLAVLSAVLACSKFQVLWL
jgi:hypothetical protein